ncbi:MAG: M23 family metallopeptidase [Anaerolineae bacterium]|nr:M23 family metallopeptidase [Anaerolineae bacterium]
MMKWLRHHFTRLPWWGKVITVLVGLAGAGCGGFAVLTFYSQSLTNSTRYIRRWFDDRDSRSELATTRRETCFAAPFVLPSNGLIGLLWNDPAAPYNLLKRHSGIDIFGDGQPGTVPVYAAYHGYLTRYDDWLATVIIRHDDPLQSGRTIWTYYTHMASRDGTTSYIADAFPPGTSEVWVSQGTLLGYQGEYSGNSLMPVGLHLHFSIVKSDPDGSFKNESRVGNTLDPSPYLGMDVNIKNKPERPIHCR